MMMAKSMMMTRLNANRHAGNEKYCTLGRRMMMVRWRRRMMMMRRRRERGRRHTPG